MRRIIRDLHHATNISSADWIQHCPEQKQIAEEVIAVVTKEKLSVNPIVTEITPAGTWCKAEPYHQEYFSRNPFQGYCTEVVGPKVAKFRKLFTAKLKT